MIRVRIWISGVAGIGHALLIERGDEGTQECYALQNPPSRSARLGAAYSGEFQGHPGTYVDLPRGFPTDNATAAQRLNDPSIPQVMQQLIGENFPLQPRIQPTVQRQAVAKLPPVSQLPLVTRPQLVTHPQPVAKPRPNAPTQPIAQPQPTHPIAQLSRPADILAEQIRRTRMRDQTSHAG